VRQSAFNCIAASKCYICAFLSDFCQYFNKFQFDKFLCPFLSALNEYVIITQKIGIIQIRIYCACRDKKKLKSTCYVNFLVICLKRYFSNSPWIIQTTSLKVENLTKSWSLEYALAVASTRFQFVSSKMKIVGNLWQLRLNIGLLLYLYIKMLFPNYDERT
jgi:hypothetical protein